MPAFAVTASVTPNVPTILVLPVLPATLNLTSVPSRILNELYTLVDPFKILTRVTSLVPSKISVSFTLSASV